MIDNEIRFWADYIDPNKYEYIYDDSEWDEAGEATPAKPSSGLSAGSRFVVIGDQNADPVDGVGTLDPILPLLDSEYTDVSVTPESAGADEQVAPDRENRSTKIARLDTALE
jgi:3-phytase